MKCTLFIAVLTIQSSHLQNVEVPIVSEKQPPSTVQLWSNGTEIWRIVTFSLDHDIHTYKIETNDPTTFKFIEDSTIRNYGDVISKTYKFEFDSCTITPAEMAKLEQEGLEPNFDVSDSITFWNPDKAAYKTISTPKQL
jgi:hypothetical protein